MTQIDWLNTPGGCYAFAYLLACCMIIRNSPKKRGTKEIIGIVTVLGSVLFVLMTVMQGTAEWLFPILTFSFFLILWAIVYSSCSYDWITSLFFTARTFIIGEFIASLEWQILYYLVIVGGVSFDLRSSAVLMIVVDGLLILFFYGLERKNHETNKNLHISGKELLSAIVIALAIFVVSNIGYAFRSAGIANMVASQLLTIRTLIDFGGVGILYGFYVQLGELNMRYEVERLQDMLEMQHNNFEVLRQSVTVVDRKYHDLKYQISVLRSEADAAGQARYLDQMEQEIKSYEARNKTGNTTLDIILTGKTLYCQINWIELTSVADGSALYFMDPMDISTLFGNLLDNAIESVIKIEQKEKRLIHLAVAKQKGFLRIRVENCYNGELKFEKGVPVTTKTDSKYHGIGIKSIQSTVRKYDGSTTIHAENGWFEMRILIPLPREKTE